MRPDGVVRVLIADDHRLFTEAVEAVLQGEQGIAVVGRAENGEEAVRLAAELEPDVVLMDLSMPRMDGFEATARICDGGGPTCVVVLTGSASSADVARARSVGACGYVTKDRIAADLVDAIRAAAGGRGTLS